MPQGSIILWSGFISNIPTGFQLCDGTNGTPDLRNRFIVGAGSDFSSGYIPATNEFGSGLFKVGDHGGQGMHQLTIPQLPAFNLTVPFYYAGNVNYVNAGPNPVVQYGTNTSTSSIGGNEPYSILPPYYSLAYIQKL